MHECMNACMDAAFALPVAEACGKFKLCHCNQKCDVQSNWVRAGYLEVEPVLNWGSASLIFLVRALSACCTRACHLSPQVHSQGMGKPLPGCDAYIPTLPPQPDPVEPVETRQRKTLDGEMLGFRCAFCLA